MGFPLGLILALQVFYNDCTHTFVFKRLVFKSIVTLSGIKQGCPMSGSIFALCIDPLIRCIQPFCPTVIMRAFADDIGIAIASIFDSLAILCRIFRHFGPISGLFLKPPKRILIPHLASLTPSFSAYLKDHVPEWATFKVRLCGRYLGFFI